MNIIKHLAIIMDGNARWARKNNLPKAEGHRKGAETIKSLLPVINKFNIPYVTLYAFSSENWQRPIGEIEVLLNLLKEYIKKETISFNEQGIKLKVIGNLQRLSRELQQELQESIDLTKENNNMTLCIAFSYGSRLEIVDACHKIIATGSRNITEESFRQYLYDPEMPDVDLLIRPSGVFRISNFLLWQLAYAELYFLKKCWPDFNEEDLIKAISAYSKRKRNFGTRK